MRHRFWKIILFVIFVLILVLGGLYVYLITRPSPVNHDFFYGVTYVPAQARYMGLDPREVYRTMLDEWGFRYVRLPVFWDELEGERGKYNWAEIDYYMNEAKRRGAKITLVVGQKTPRWPECHLPGWSRGLGFAEYRTELEKYISETVIRYRNHSALEIWQVENEPFLPFGAGCPDFDRGMLKKEIELVKKLDSKHPILVTDSGELSTWYRTANAGDYFGTTMYKVVWNRFLGYMRYDWVPPYFYEIRLNLNKLPAERAMVAELQAEPWATDTDIFRMPLAEQYKSMDLARLKAHTLFASQSGMSRAYFWGVEWWYWLKTQGVPEFGDYVKTLKKK